MVHRYHHWTEKDPRIREFVAARWGGRVRNRNHGPDLSTAGVLVEVKAAREWNRTSCANGKRRRGRFQIAGYERADFFLFVLIRDGGMLEMKALAAGTVRRKFGRQASVRWSAVFTRTEGGARWNRNASGIS